MSVERKKKPEGRSGSSIAESAAATDALAPRKLTFAENLILTIKILAGFGLLGAVLWVVQLWKSAR